MSLCPVGVIQSALPLVPAFTRISKFVNKLFWIIIWCTLMLYKTDLITVQSISFSASLNHSQVPKHIEKGCIYTKITARKTQTQIWSNSTLAFFRITRKICNARSVVMRNDDIRLRTPSFSDLNSTSIIVTLICLHKSGWICYRYCTVCIYKTWFRKGKKCFDFWKLQRETLVYMTHIR